MASYNRVILIGNLTRDPQLRYLQSGTAMCEIGLAVSDRRKGPNGEWIDEPIFVDITLWERTAETAGEYLTKGSPVLIEGRLRMDRWQDKNDGQTRTKLKVTGDRMVMLGTRGGQAGGEGGGAPRAAARQGSPYSQPATAPEEYDAPPAETRGPEAPAGDDIPF
jgi:single-strand DNA-binding protein